MGSVLITLVGNLLLKIVVQFPKRDDVRGISQLHTSVVSFAAVTRVVTHRSSPLTAAHSSSAFLSLCYWEPITCMYLLATRQSYFSLHLLPKTGFPENGSLLLIGQFEEKNAELEWAAVSWEDRCVTTLITPAKETNTSVTTFRLVRPSKKKTCCSSGFL